MGAKPTKRTERLGHLADPRAIERVIELLATGRYNADTLDRKQQEELRSYVDIWIKAKGDLWRCVQLCLKEGKSVSFTSGTFYLPANARHFVTHPSGRNRVQGVFQQFVLHPDAADFAGPCKRPGCGRYFPRKGYLNKVYCTEECARSISALTSMRKKRAERKESRIAAMRRAIAKWERNPLKASRWEVWVAAEMPEEAGKACSPKLVTHYVRQGFVQPPRGNKNAR